MRPLVGLLRPVHRWAGLGVGGLFLFQATTGVLLVNQEAFTTLLHPEARLPAAPEHRASLDAILQAEPLRDPAVRLDRITYPEDARLPLAVRIVRPDGAAGILLLHPQHARTLSSGSLAAYPEQWAETAHGSLMLGQTGHWLVFAEGVLLVIMAGSGLLLWWPGRNRLVASLTIHTGAPWRRRLRDLHVVPGAFAASLFLVIGLTGALMAAEPFTTALVGRFAAVDPDVEIDVPTTPNWTPSLSAQQALDRIQARFPNSRLTKVRPLGPANRVIMAVLADTHAGNPMVLDAATLDRATGRLTVLADSANMSGGSATIAWLTPIHSGMVYGPFRALVATGGGLAMISMALTGVIGWLARRRARRRPTPGV